MGTLIPIVSLLIVVALGLLITRIGTVALMLTGLSQELAHFQALSAFMGVGFTTEESERVLEHPVRRRIIRWLILFGNAGFVATISSMIPVFMNVGAGVGAAPKLLWLICGLILLWMLASSKWIDRQLSLGIGWALKRWTHLDILDYHGLLHLGEGYTVSEVRVAPGDWVAGRNLIDLRLGDEGVQILAIRRADHEFIGVPTGQTYIRRGDTLICYGKVEQLAELGRRPAGTEGDAAHAERVQALRLAAEPGTDGARIAAR